jgi:hypothetical protein
LKGKEPQVEDDAALMLAPAPLLSNQREGVLDASYGGLPFSFFFSQSPELICVCRYR